MNLQLFKILINWFANHYYVCAFNNGCSRFYELVKKSDFDIDEQRGKEYI